MLSKLISCLETADNTLIIMHEYPDGDAISSALVLYLMLGKMGKRVRVICKDDIPEVFNFLPHVDKIGNDFIMADYDTLCAVDCGDLKRTGFVDRIKIFARQKKRLINIDHHKRSDLHKLANFNFVDDSAAASAQLVEELMRELNFKIDRDIATLLLTGIYTDTGGFQHSNTNQKVYGLSSRLLACGAQLNKISRHIAFNKRVSSLKLWGLALTRVRISKNGIALSYIKHCDIAQCAAGYEDLAGVVNVINSIPNSKLAILFTEIPDGKIKASIRTEKSDVDVAQFAGFFGGGGHKKAAGFTIDGRIKESSNGAWVVESI